MMGLLEPELHPQAGQASPAGRWMQVLSHLHPKYGGISAVVPAMVQSLSGQMLESSIAAFCSEGEAYVPDGVDPNAVHFWPIGRSRWIRDRSLNPRFEAEMRNYDGVHIHGLWDVTSVAASRAARRWNKPYVLSCHGMLEPWALNQGKLKKQIYSALIERDVVREASCLHALTEAEAAQYRTYTGTDTPAVVIPNGVSVPDDLSPELCLEKYPELRDRRIVLFLARLHVKKGVDLLVHAWQRIIAKVPDAMLVLAGPDSDGLSATLKDVAISEGIQDSVLFTGMLAAEMKWSALAAAECLILPSHSEGLSMSVLEAMGAGLPVVVTPQCNMPWIPEVGAGWLTDPTRDAIAETLVEVLSRTREANAGSGALARAFIRQNYSWSSVAERIAEVYEWCLGGNQPVLSEVIR